MPTWATIYLFFIIVGGFLGLYYYRKRGLYFIVGESFSLIFTLMIFLYNYELYPKPSSILVPIMMFLYIIYWEFVENFKLLKDELEREITSKMELNIMVFLMTMLFTPFIYIAVTMFLKY